MVEEKDEALAIRVDSQVAAVFCISIKVTVGHILAIKSPYSSVSDVFSQKTQVVTFLNNFERKDRKN